MKFIDFPERTHLIGENQPQYLTLPAHVSQDETGTITCCCQFNWKERLKLLLTGKLWHRQMTFRTSMQPIQLTTEKPSMMK